MRWSLLPRSSMLERFSERTTMLLSITTTPPDPTAT
jgi:hypothetical protein